VLGTGAVADGGRDTHGDPDTVNVHL